MYGVSHTNRISRIDVVTQVRCFCAVWPCRCVLPCLLDVPPCCPRCWIDQGAARVRWQSTENKAGRFALLQEDALEFIQAAEQEHRNDNAMEED